MSTKNKVFNAEAAKGYILKITIDSLAHLNRGHFVIDNNGIRLRQADKHNFSMYDMDYNRKYFRNFKCTRPLAISFNLKHMQSLLKNVKKKDSVTMFIDQTKPNKLFVTIRPDGPRKNTRFETNSIVYQEEKDYKLMDLPEGGYKHPMVIDGTDFQKIKRLTGLGNPISITIQGNNYLSFKCDAGVVSDSELGFGELTDEDSESDPGSEESYPSTDTDTDTDYDDPDEECGDCGLSDSRCTCKCDECGNLLRKCRCENDGQPSYDELDSGEIKGLFSAQYSPTLLTKLVKLPSLCTQMQFYAPTIPQFPLLIEVKTGQGGYTLGTIKVYLKDVAQIAYEESIRNESEVWQSTGGKKTKRK
jgi:hypothetical protein